MTLMVHGVSDQAFISSPEGSNKAGHSDSVFGCTAPSYVKDLLLKRSWKISTVMTPLRIVMVLKHQ